MAGPFTCEECGCVFERPGPGMPPKACPDCRPKRASRRSAEWQKANPERTAQNRAKTWKKYYAAHSEELIAKQLERQRANPELKAAYDSAYYARTRGSVDAENFTLDEIYRRDGGECHLCEEPVSRDQATMDHVIPASLGGPHTRANVRLAHRSCNSSRKTMPVEEWRARRAA